MKWFTVEDAGKNRYVLTLEEPPRRNVPTAYTDQFIMKGIEGVLKLGFKPKGKLAIFLVSLINQQQLPL
jgi:hypothetical protein